MSNAKKINVNYSSLVGLKAELLRKQTEVKDAKAKAETIRTLPKPKVRTKKPEKAKLAAKEPIDIDDINAHKKSKLMLEAKSRLYDRLKKSRSNRMENLLVDFENKSDESEVEPSDYEDSNSDSEDDWVDYEDCFGRTRRCLRRDLPRMREKDDLLKQDVMKNPEGSQETREVETKQNYIVPEKEPEIEIMRRKWEDQTERLMDKTDIHYQDVLFDEARAHGVGYYEFSQEEGVRAKQQANLAALRKETVRKQKEMQDLREQRNRMELNRLKAARIRQRIRAGLPPEEPEDDEIPENKIPEHSESEDKDSAPKQEENVERKEDSLSNPQSSLVEIENKIKAFGELIGKRSKWHEMSQEEWVHKRRKDRLGEFAPVYSNFKSVGYLNNENAEVKDDRTVDSSSNDRLSDTSDSEAEVGPMPPPGFRMEETVQSRSSAMDAINNMGPDKMIPLTSNIGVEKDDPSSIETEASHNGKSPPTEADISSSKHSLDEDKISAGLKFLRHNFEKRDTS